MVLNSDHTTFKDCYAVHRQHQIHLLPEKPCSPDFRRLGDERHAFFITQNGEASMVVESVKHFQEKEALIAALKIIALGEKDRLQGKGISAVESRVQLAAARQRRK